LAGEEEEASTNVVTLTTGGLVVLVVEEPDIVILLEIPVRMVSAGEEEAVVALDLIPADMVDQD
jgi:hypothetical protein